MRAFVVFAACITACVAATSGYGHVRLDIPSYTSPLETTTTPAPIVYTSYDQPAIRVRKPNFQVKVLRVNEQPAYPEVQVLRTTEQPTSYVQLRTEEQPTHEVKVLKTHRKPTHERKRLRTNQQPIHEVNVLNTQQQPTQEFTRVSHRRPASHVKVLRVNDQLATPEVLRTSEQPSSHVKIVRPFIQPAPQHRLVAKKEQVPILRYVLNDNNNGNYQVETLSGDQTKMNMEGTLKDVAGPEAEGPVSVMKGSYSYVGPDQKTYSVTWQADEPP